MLGGISPLFAKGGALTAIYIASFETISTSATLGSMGAQVGDILFAACYNYITPTVGSGGAFVGPLATYGGFDTKYRVLTSADISSGLTVPGGGYIASCIIYRNVKSIAYIGNSTGNSSISVSGFTKNINHIGILVNTNNYNSYYPTGPITPSTFALRLAANTYGYYRTYWDRIGSQADYISGTTITLNDTIASENFNNAVYELRSV